MPNRYIRGIQGNSGKGHQWWSVVRRGVYQHLHGNVHSHISHGLLGVLLSLCYLYKTNNLLVWVQGYLHYQDPKTQKLVSDISQSQCQVNVGRILLQVCWWLECCVMVKVSMSMPIPILEFATNQYCHSRLASARRMLVLYCNKIK